MKKAIIISHNEMFDGVREHFESSYEVLPPFHFHSYSDVYEEELLRRAAKIDPASLSGKIGPVGYQFVQKTIDGLFLCFSIQDALVKLDSMMGVSSIVLHAAGGVPASAHLKVGNSLGIPTFVLQNGIWPNAVDKSHYSTSHQEQSVILCMSEYMRDIYIKLGADESKLVITGHPYFDRYESFERKETERPLVLVGNALTLFNCNTVGSRIPWFYFPPADFKNYFRIFEIAEKLPEFDFVIKLKPHGLLTPQHFFDSPKNVRAHKNSWFEWMNKASVVLGDTSTISLESIFAGVPTIVPKWDTPFVDFMGAAIEVDWTVDNVVSAIKNSIGKEVDNGSFSSYYFSHNLDFNSTVRVTEEIEGRINEYRSDNTS